MSLHWQIKSFQELSAIELYKILQLRINVFMLEQDCLYPECDDKDQSSEHLFATASEEIVAYARLLPPGISYADSSIGRVIVAAQYRSQNIGQELIAKAITRQRTHFADKDIRISAQAHLQRFYENMGFVRQGESYLEDDIPHIEMVYYTS